MDPVKGSKDILDEIDIKISESQPWNTRPIEATADVAFSFWAYFCKPQKVELTFTRSNHHMDLLKTAKDTTKQFDFNLSDPEAMKIIAEQSVTSARDRNEKEINFAFLNFKNFFWNLTKIFN